MCKEETRLCCAVWAADPYQQNEPNRRTLSCALCGRLQRTFPAGAPVGAPDLIMANVGVNYSLVGVPEDEQHHFTAWWDMHAFGAWLANLAASRGHEEELATDKIVENINLFKASNGEEIHGFLWQSLRLLAYDTGTLQGTRIANPPHKVAVDHAHTVCEPMWYLAPQSMNDCAHAAGHVRGQTRSHLRSGLVCAHADTVLTATLLSPHTQGYFYYFLDIVCCKGSSPALCPVQRPLSPLIRV
jgi:hypothetical protein